MSETTLQGPDADESTTLGKLAAALAKAQGAMEAAKADATNSGYGRKYATLASVWDACRKPLADNGLAVVQRVGGDERRIIITTDLIHAESGEFTRSRVVVPAETDGRRNTAQAMGTSISYLRRYQLAAMVGIAQEDDDAESAGKPAPKRQRDEPRDETPRTTTGPTTLPNYGPFKGANIRDAPPHVLDKYLEDARKELADPSKAKFHGKASALIGALEAELKRQGGAVPEGQRETKTGPALTPMDRIAALAKELGIPGTRVAEWLKGNGLKDRESVTETFVEAFRKWAKEWTLANARDPQDHGSPNVDDDRGEDAPF